MNRRFHLPRKVILILSKTTLKCKFRWTKMHQNNNKMRSKQSRIRRTPVVFIPSSKTHWRAYSKAHLVTCLENRIITKVTHKELVNRSTLGLASVESTLWVIQSRWISMTKLKLAFNSEGEWSHWYPNFLKSSRNWNISLLAQIKIKVV